MDHCIVSSIFSSRAESGRYNVETRKENMHEHTGASHAAAFCLDEAENNTSTTHYFGRHFEEDEELHICVQKSLCTVQYACVHHHCMREARGPRINFVQKSLCHTGCMICVRSWSFFLTNKSEVFRSSNRHSVLVMTPNQLKLCRRNENAMLNRLVSFSKGFLEK